MVERTPVEAKNLDRYGNPILAWEGVLEVLTNPPVGPDKPFFLGTAGSDGRPHSAGIGPVWYDGDLYFTSGPNTRKSRHLAGQPACTLSTRLNGYDLVLEGEATRVADESILEAVAERYRAGGWPAVVESDGFTAPYSAPSAGPPPWHLYRFRFHSVVALKTEEPGGATRWRFK